MRDKKSLMDRVAQLMADLQDAVQLLDESAAAQIGLNLTDLRCVRQIVQQGPQSPSELARATGLTRAAISAVLDRLEAANVAQRIADPSDRRRTLVEPTEKAREAIAKIWSPVETEGRRELASYTAVELAVIVDFIAKSIELHHKHSIRLQDSVARVR